MTDLHYTAIKKKCFTFFTVSEIVVIQLHIAAILRAIREGCEAFLPRREIVSEGHIT